MTNLPIEPLLPKLAAELAAKHLLVLEAPPGAGKTTLAPLALLDSPWLAGQRIIMLEPRRLAARNAAVRMAELLGEEVGQSVGYRVRFEHRVGPSTRIEVVTEGILTRRLQEDPELAGVGLVIFDEFHERHLHSDLALALCLDAQQGLREDLRLLIMSATIDPRIAERLMAPRLISEGRSYPVDLRLLPADPQGPLVAAVLVAIERALTETKGDILVFLPGAGEILRCRDELLRRTGFAAEQVFALYGDMPLAAQRAALVPDPQGRRKLVLATPIAETSLTIEGVDTVIDSGWMRVPRFDPRSGLTRLETVRVTRANADQRAGRAGRLGPGTCYRLWGPGTDQGLVPHPQPEILQADLAPLALEMAAWGIGDPETLTWLDPVPPGAYAQARELLQALDALDGEGRITALGREMVALPMHPRLAHMLVRSRELDAGAEAWACDLAALLGERDILSGREGAGACDLGLRLDALLAHRTLGAAGARRVGAEPARCAAVERVAERLRGLLGVHAPRAEAKYGLVGLLLAQAYPDRIAQRRSGEQPRYLLANGRGARLDPGCGLAREAYIVAAEVDGAGEDARVRLAAPVTVEALRTQLDSRIEHVEAVRWDRSQQTVLAQREERLGAMLLSSRPQNEMPVGRITEVLLSALAEQGLDVLPWTDEARELQARAALLASCDKQGNWPRLDDTWLLEHLSEWLAPWLDGMSRFDHLRRLDLRSILQGLFSWQAWQRLEEGAPTHLSVPSGNRRRLDYRTPDGPVLAVKLQEMFGQAQTPTVCWGRVPVVLHLLSPAQRPIQVTRDLAGFWARTYAEVKKELKGRYPKHPWPDDPTTATPTAGTRRRG